MKILALERELPGATPERFEPLLKDEARCVWRLQQSGVVREIYFHAEQHTAILVLECANTEEAHQLLADLPMVTAGLIDFDLIPLVPYDGFARLFVKPLEDGGKMDV
jgi:muconolactone delta-isomerase